MTISAKDILSEMQYSKHEKECFEKLSSILNQQHSIDSIKLDGLEKEDIAALSRGGIEFNVVLYDRLNTIEKLFVHLIVEHPGFILDKQAYRLGMLSLGFMRVLLDYIVPELGDEKNEEDAN